MRYVLVVLLALTMGLWGWSNYATQAQTEADSFQSLLLELNQSDTVFTISFVSAVPRIGQSVDIGNGQPYTLDRIGRDMTCIVFIGQALNQYQCVPYSQIATVTYAR